ncbi:MAG: SRPBCC domain-containing protein [Solirubrobacterales bacterium]
MSPSTEGLESMRLVREIAAPPEKIYDAWINPEQLIRWIGPEQFEVTRTEVEPKVGGRAQIWAKREGTEIGLFNWDFVEMVPPERLVLDFAFADREKEPDSHRSRLTLEMREQDPGVTELTLIHERLKPDSPQDAAGVTEGWGEVIGRLQGHLEPSGKGE